MESLLGSILGVVVYLNYILITGPSEQEHLDALDTMLQRLLETGLKQQKAKVYFSSTISDISGPPDRC